MSQVFIEHETLVIWQDHQLIPRDGFRALDVLPSQAQAFLNNKKKVGSAWLDLGLSKSLISA
jgi:hypothetical protein